MPERTPSGDRRLTSFSHGAGCGCKLSARDLQEIMGLARGLTASSPPSALLVGFTTSDDAAVWQLRPDLAAILTTDFFTPIVDDPYDWGRIAAANALSDVYAMGGNPLLALNLVAWPREDLSFDVLARVLDGGADIAARAGVVVGGGHSIDDREPKYGMAVFGTIDPHDVLSNSAARVGDRLVLTKPIGVGAISTGLKNGTGNEDLEKAAIDVMTTLNGPARDAALETGVGAATDVTGFGLIGHLQEMLNASGVAADLDLASVPVLDGARQLVSEGMISGGARRNHEHVSATTDWGPIGTADQYILADPQTSGGLLLAVPAHNANALIDALGRTQPGVAASVIGSVIDGPAGHVRVA